MHSTMPPKTEYLPKWWLQPSPGSAEIRPTPNLSKTLEKRDLPLGKSLLLSPKEREALHPSGKVVQLLEEILCVFRIGKAPD